MQSNIGIESRSIGRIETKEKIGIHVTKKFVQHLKKQ